MGCQPPSRRQERRVVAANAPAYPPHSERRPYPRRRATAYRPQPMRRFKKRLPKVEHHEMATLTPEQSAHLLHAVRHSHIYWPVPVGFATRARRGEALATPWRNVDRDRGTIRIAIAARPGLVKTPVKASKQWAETARQLEEARNANRVVAGVFATARRCFARSRGSSRGRAV